MGGFGGGIASSELSSKLTARGLGGVGPPLRGVRTSSDGLSPLVLTKRRLLPVPSRRLRRTSPVASGP